MKYLKITNCPLNGCLINNAKGNIDWKAVGMIPSTVSRLSVQGYIEITDGKGSGDYITILPISDEVQFKSIESQVVDNINNNDFENDSAIIIEQSEYEALKITIEAVKTQLKEINSL